MDVSPGLQQKMTSQESMGLKCGVIGDLKVSWKDRRTNEWVLNKMDTRMILTDSIRTRKLQYFGHIMRRENSIEKQIIQGAVEGRRGRGRPITSWRDSIKAVTGSLAVATRRAADRDGWRALIKATAAPKGAI